MAILSSPITFIQGIPSVTRYFTVATITTSLLYAWLNWKAIDHNPAYLVLIPGSSYIFPWTLVTSALVEISILELIFTLIVVPPSLRYLERLWGASETIKFIIVCVGASNIIAFAFNWIEYIATRSELFLYGMQYRGQMALQIAVAVAFTQLIPEHQIQLFGIYRVRVKTVPMVLLTLSTILCFIGLQCPWIVIQFGWFVSWIYLRFYKKNTSDSGVDTYGDRSETFALVSWFPPFLHRPLSALGNFVHRLANRFHLIPAVHDVESNGYNPLPGGARAEAERRRALALKALDQRLAAGSGTLSPGPSRPPSATPHSVASASQIATPSSTGSDQTHDKQRNGEIDLGETTQSKS